ncbi:MULTISPECIES: hypothetical protein [Peribacillus]|nr:MULTISPECIES: hypothetical protein [Peribacillus]MBD8591005.1 hypothetical protein [Peribacillus simplex]MCM3169575.1 hypothetical protein [Peribacillus frigoritolerans]MEE3955813.1 hypothetical protein [Peribacillus frigoritolerans]PAL14738.1 hypothetical protein B8W99_04755 [Peribacillus simplex]
MSERMIKLEERIEKRKARIEKLQNNLKDEKAKLTKDEEILLHLKYNDVLKLMQETGVSPDEAIRAIDNEKTKNQPDEENQPHHKEGEKNYERIL